MLTEAESNRLDKIEEMVTAIFSRICAQPLTSIKSTETRLIELARINPRAAIDEAKRLARAGRKGAKK